MIRVIALDETQYWHEDWRKREGINGRIFGLYLYDDSRAVHCCEVTASRELHWIGPWATDGDEDAIGPDGRALDRERRGPFPSDDPHISKRELLEDKDSSEPVSYMHASRADRLSYAEAEGWSSEELEEDEDEMLIRIRESIDDYARKLGLWAED